MRRKAGEAVRVPAPAVVALATAFLAAGGVASLAQERQSQSPSEEIEVLHVRGPVYAVFGAGSNVTVSVGLDGVLLVDSGSAPMAGELLVTIERLQEFEMQARARFPSPTNWAAETRSTLVDTLGRLSPGSSKPVRYLINTHARPDHVGGNETIVAAGRTYTGGNVAGNIADATVGATVYSHENVYLQMAEAGASIRALPTNTYRRGDYKLNQFFNGEGIQLVHPQSAYTDGDTMVWFRGSDVISTGDIYSTLSYPLIDIDRGGSIEGIIDALNRVLELAFAEFRHEGGTMIVPGHGRLSDYADVARYRDMVTMIRDRIEDMIAKGMTLEQVQAAAPTLDFDPRYDSPRYHVDATSSWTAERFVEAVYRSLNEGQ